MRCPDMAVDLRRDGRVPGVTLVQMPNGTGKTTTLELLNATFSGSAQGWRPEDVRAFRRSEDDRAGREIQSDFVGGRKAVVDRAASRLWHRAGQLSHDESGERRCGAAMARSAVDEPVPDPGFLRLFIFDGEFAGRLFGRRSDRGRSRGGSTVPDLLAQGGLGVRAGLLGEVVEVGYDANEGRSGQSRSETRRARHAGERVDERA